MVLMAVLMGKVSKKRYVLIILSRRANQKSQEGLELAS
jgi:hypothetical protein